MPTLNWSDTLMLDFAPMDEMHREFVTLLADVEACPDTELAHRWAHLVQRTQALFGREDDWMKSTHFSSGANHLLQHRVVLNVMREGLGLARSGDNTQVRGMATELAHWFAKHIQSLDAALALHLRRSTPLPAQV
jgi:hemerythrin-like metal-binding protein